MDLSRAGRLLNEIKSPHYKFTSYDPKTSEKIWKKDYGNSISDYLDDNLYTEAFLRVKWKEKYIFFFW